MKFVEVLFRLAQVEDIQIVRRILEAGAVCLATLVMELVVYKFRRLLW